MKHKRIGVLLAFSALVALPALAGTVYINGQPCFTSGNNVNCPNGVGNTGGSSGVNEDARARMAETRRKQAQSQALTECLRKSDWPGSMSRSECERAYGE